MNNKMVNDRKASAAVVIGIDPHKASWTAAAVSSALQPVATIRVPVSREGYRRLREFAAQWPAALWAIEGAGGLGAPLSSWLTADRIVAVDVPAKLASRVRMLSAGHGRKSDDADATSVGIAALTAARLQTVAADETIIVLRALVEHRDDVVKTRTQTVNRLHVLLTRLLPGGAPRELTPPRQPFCCARYGPATPPDRPCVASPSTSSPRSVTWTDASPRPTPRSPKRCAPAEPP